MKPIIIALGGSIIAPKLLGHQSVNVNFLKKFKKLILQEIKLGKSFIIVAGGGKVAKSYQKAIQKFKNIKQEDIDLIGIQGTKLNASFLEAIFRKKIKKNCLLIAAGTKPGWSTDYVSVCLAQKHKAEEIIIATNIDFVFNKDPRKFKDAKPVKKISFQDYQKIIPQKWMPAMNLPFDPVATRLAKKLKLKIKVLRAENLESFKNAIENKEFRGSVIENFKSSVQGKKLL